MKLKNYFLLVFVLFATFACDAQTVTVSEELVLRSDDGYQIIGKMKNRFLLFRLKGNDEYEVQAYDEKLRLSWKKEIELDKKNPKFIEVIPQEDNFVVIYQFRNKGATFLKAAKFDPAANLIDSTSFYNLGNTWYTPNFNSDVSEDRSKVVLSAVEKQSYLQLYAFDVKNMKFLWENKIKPERILEPKASEFFIVDNQANFYYINEKDNRKSRLEDHRIEVFKAAGAGNENISLKIFPLSEYMVYDLKFAFDNVNRVLIAGGLYSDNSRARANGIFVLKTKGGIEDANLYSMEFDDSFLAGISGRGVDEEKGVSEVDVSQMVFTKNGGVTLLLERSRILERRANAGGRGYYGRNGQAYVVDYYNDDVLAISLDNEGRLLWQDIFHKKQYSQDDGGIYSSYFLFKTPSQLRLVFNDDIRNETTISEYVIKASGYSDRNAVFSTESQELKLRFREALQIASTEFLVPSERRSRFRLVRVAF